MLLSRCDFKGMRYTFYIPTCFFFFFSFICSQILPNFWCHYVCLVDSESTNGYYLLYCSTKYTMRTNIFWRLRSTSTHKSNREKHETNEKKKSSVKKSCNNENNKIEMWSKYRIYRIWMNRHTQNMHFFFCAFILFKSFNCTESRDLFS